VPNWRNCAKTSRASVSPPQPEAGSSFPEFPTMPRSFPTGFLWGAATSAHQTEGHNTLSDNWLEEHVAQSPYPEVSGEAIDHYRRYRDDIALLASLGLKAYRFSVEWSRVEPKPGEFSAEALAHYRDMADTCLAHGLEPVVALHHFSSPQWLLGQGGWHGAETPALFARYVEAVMRAFGARVHRVITLNECNIGVLLRSLFQQLEFVPPVGVDVAAWKAPAWRAAAAAACGIQPDRYCNFQMAGDAQGVATIGAAHRAARDVIRRFAPGVQVGLSLAISQVQLVDGGDATAAQAWHGNFRQWLPVIEGDDFFGLQNYTREVYGPEGQVRPPAEAERTDMGYEFAPEALAGVLRDVARELRLPILVSENGIATTDDTRRIAFLDRALAGLHGCIADGVPVLGYLHWSAFDNFEWVFGYAQRFGLIAVDRATQQRSVKLSAHHYAAIVAANALPEHARMEAQPGPGRPMPQGLRHVPPAPNAVVFTQVKVFDGGGAPSFAGEVRVEGNRIVAVARDGETVSRENARIVDGRGGTLMPGLVEAHAHLTWPTSVEKFVPGMVLPPEELALTAARNARILLDHGFTSAYSAGALSKRLEVVLRDQIESGGLPGPRLIPSSVEREPPSDGSFLDAGHADEHGAGPDSVRAFVKGCAELGAKSVKFLLSGESALKPGASLEVLYSEDEVRAAGEQARDSEVWLTGHAHANEAIRMGLRHGFRVLYHCTYADDETLDQLEAARDRIFVGPSIGIIQATLDADPPPHIDMTHMKQDAAEVLARQKALVPELKRRGIRLVPGGDYGFPFNPTGRNARDLALWVEHFGYTPAEALHAATALGGQLMGRGDELGRVRAGALADLLLVDGDPTADVTLLQNKQRLKAIMKDGRFHKAPEAQA
jgi:beta-glucosidase/6-phospho-beta-glucosidase/beta-galactosidase/imidazolonepropionase-like amidohydrolase